MRAAVAVISFVAAAVLLIAAYEQHKQSLAAGNLELVQESPSRSANGQVVHVFKANHENEGNVEMETALGMVFLAGGLALVGSLTMTKKCPYCGNHINASVSICHVCGEDLAAANKKV